MNREDFIDEIIGSLGGTIVDVELEPTDIDRCFRKAKRMFIQKGHNSYRRQFLSLDVSRDQTVYPIPESVDTIIKIIKPTYGWTTEDPFAMATYNDVFTNSFSGTGSADFLSYELTLQLVERWQRYTVYDSQFSHDKFRNELTLLRKPERTTKWLVECYSNLEDTEYYDINWIIQWTVAEAKEMLGIAYRKLGSVAGPTGETQLSGSEYIQEAKQEKEALLLDIENFTDGAADYMEIRFG